MMKLKVDIDYKRDESKLTEEEKKSWLNNIELTYNYINHAVSEKYKDGIEDSSKRRTFARIQRKFDNAIIDNSEFILLENAEAYFLKELFRGKVSFLPYLSKYVVLLEDEIDGLKEDKEEK